MADNQYINLEDFKAWVATATMEQLEVIFDSCDLEETLLDLEAEDFFGTEGINKRFA